MNILKQLETKLNKIEESIAKLNNPEFPELMTLKEASKFLRISERKLRELVKEKRVPFYRVGGENINSKLLFSKRKLLLWLETGKTTFSKRERERVKFLIE